MVPCCPNTLTGHEPPSDQSLPTVNPAGSSRIGGDHTQWIVWPAASTSVVSCRLPCGPNSTSSTLFPWPGSAPEDCCCGSESVTCWVTTPPDELLVTTCSVIVPVLLP